MSEFGRKVRRESADPPGAAKLNRRQPGKDDLTDGGVDGPRLAAQRRIAEDVGNSPRVLQQRARLEQLGLANTSESAVSPRPNRTGLPDALKSGIEDLSGMSMDHVRVHYNSAQPARLNAHAYAQGNDIHLAAGQERHLPHEAWHVVQQAQGRVAPTMQTHGGVPVNDDSHLECEADRVGDRALGTVSQRQPMSRRPPARHAAGGLPVQCVGGEKFGLQPLGNPQTDTDIAEGIAALKDVMTRYKGEIKTAKAQAIEEFERGDKSNHDRQQVYTRALQDAEMTPAGLFDRLDNELVHANGFILFRSKRIAQIHQGNLAYVQSTAARDANHSAIYKRHTLDGPSSKEYVSFGGGYVRRFAYRGITPAERAQYKQGQALTPLNRGSETVGSTGFKFDKQTGAASARDHDPSNNQPTDLEWLNAHAKTALGAVPNNPRLLAFLQTRKGVNKAFSATSTPRSISSNHGATFTEYGNIEIDLASVPIANVTHHYKAAPFTRDDVAGTLGRRPGLGDTLTWETERANESVARNRELVLSSIPNAAVRTLYDTPERKAYEERFAALYRIDFAQRFEKHRDDLELPNVPAPQPTFIPYIEDHFTVQQATMDQGSIFRFADEYARKAIVLLKTYVEAYLKQYPNAWIAGFKEIAYTKASDVDVPKVTLPAAKDVPVEGSGNADGSARGWKDGKEAGEQAAIELYGPVDDEEEDEEGDGVDD